MVTPSGQAGAVEGRTEALRDAKRVAHAVRFGIEDGLHSVDSFYAGATHVEHVIRRLLAGETADDLCLEVVAASDAADAKREQERSP